LRRRCTDLLGGLIAGWCHFLFFLALSVALAAGLAAAAAAAAALVSAILLI